MSTLFGGGASAATASAGAANTTGDISKDVTLNQPPEDSISDMAFSPASDHLAVASWDKKVRIYEINEQGMSEGKALFEHEAPVLSCCWSPVSFPLSIYTLPPARAAKLTGCTFLGWIESRRCWCRQGCPHA